MFGAFTSFGKLGAIGKAIAAAWSPADLTALAAWYDPSDLSTMFNDSAGTTPVATPGTVADSANPVGLIQDKSVNDRHASQSTSTARPLLSARVNLIRSTENFLNVWNGSGASAADILDWPIGADKYQWFTCPANTPLRIEFDYSVASGPDGTFHIALLGESNTYVNATGTVQRYSGVHSTATENPYFLFGKVTSGTAFRVSRISVFPESLGELPYQRVTTDSDYDGDPAKFPYKKQFDGVDDFQVTASGGGASTAAMVCLGFTSTLAGTAQTLWTDRTGNTGLSLGISAGNAIVLSGGNGSSIVTVTGDAVTLGTPYVVTALYDGTDLSVQLNDATPVTGACALSAGQAAITLGAATGGASGFFKGSIFDVLYVKDATTSPADVAEAKAWVAAKSGVTLP